jgi:hypothetical protein
MIFGQSLDGIDAQRLARVLVVERRKTQFCTSFLPPNAWL